MAYVDVGAAAINRAGSTGSGSTVVSKDNPANETGLICYIAIYCPTNPAEGIKVAAFSAVGNDMTTRGWTALGNANVGLTEYNAPEDFVAFEIEEGDYIGIYMDSSTYIDFNQTSGPGIWLKISSDQIPCVSEEFISGSNSTLSLYAEGYQLGQINIGDVHKVKQNILINVGDDWKQIVPGSGINIGDVWKDILH